MPRYDYRCRVCDVTFEVRRGLTERPTAVTPCPGGHTDTSRVFSAVAVAGRGRDAPAPAPARPAAAGGCCGGGCCAG